MPYNVRPPRTACRHAQPATTLPRWVPRTHLTPAPSADANRPNAMPYNVRPPRIANRHAQPGTSLPRRVPDPHLKLAPSKTANRPNAMPCNVRPAHTRAATPSRPPLCRVRRPGRTPSGATLVTANAAALADVRGLAWQDWSTAA